MMLQLHGHAVTWAVSISEATERCREQTFDLLIAEIHLPDGSGLDFMREVAAPIGLRGIALTSLAYARDQQKSIASGFSEHLTKPVTMDQLLAAVSRVTP